jgi:putative ABC transport system ATP-binding protein
MADATLTSGAPKAGYYGPHTDNSSNHSAPLGGTPVNDAIIEVESLEKVYESGEIRTYALRGVDLRVQRGEMLAVMGPSGCGKTTLLNCLSGIDDPTAGIVRIEGTDLATLDDDTRTGYRAKRMGFIFQFYNLLPVLSAAENVELPLLISGSSPAESRERALAALDRVGLAEWHRHRPAQLSGGQRQRVTIARALVNNPAIVWADEPTGDLDTANADDIMSLMQELNRERQQTFVIVTHDPQIAARCHRTIYMQDGNIIREERAAEVAAGG